MRSLCVLLVTLPLAAGCGEKDPGDSTPDDSGGDDSGAPELESSWTVSEEQGCGAPVSVNWVTVHGAAYGEHVLLVSDQPWTCEERLAARAQLVQADAAYTVALENTESTGQALCEAAVLLFQTYATYYDPFYPQGSCAAEVYFYGAPAAGVNYTDLELHLAVPQDSAGIVAELGDCATDAGATYAQEDARIFAAVYNNVSLRRFYSEYGAAVAFDEDQGLAHFSFGEKELYPGQGSETRTFGMEVYAERCEL